MHRYLGEREKEVSHTKGKWKKHDNYLKVIEENISQIVTILSKKSALQGLYVSGKRNKAESIDKKEQIKTWNNVGSKSMRCKSWEKESSIIKPIE
jgi:hypothetical protein